MTDMAVKINNGNEKLLMQSVEDGHDEQKNLNGRTRPQFTEAMGYTDVQGVNAQMRPNSQFLNSQFVSLLCLVNWKMDWSGGSGH